MCFTIKIKNKFLKQVRIEFIDIFSSLGPQAAVFKLGLNQVNQKLRFYEYYYKYQSLKF